VCVCGVCVGGGVGWGRGYSAGIQSQRACRSSMHADHNFISSTAKSDTLQPTAPLRLCLPARRRAAETTAALRQGAANGGEMVDCGSMCMPGAAEKVQELVDDAVRKGAQVGDCHGGEMRMFVCGCVWQWGGGWRCAQGGPGG
jgi:hypothetical protein